MLMTPRENYKSVFKNYSGYTKPIIFHTVISTYYNTVVDQSPMHSKIVSEMIQSSQYMFRHYFISITLPALIFKVEGIFNVPEMDANIK